MQLNLPQLTGLSAICRRLRKSGLLLICSTAALATVTLAGLPPTDLFVRGYSVVPAPRRVSLQPEDIEFSSAWSLRVEVPAGHAAARSLLRDLETFHALRLQADAVATDRLLRLAVAAGTVRTGGDPEIDKQAYRLKIAPGLIEIVGNGDPGLFYGVQTLLQLLRTKSGGGLQLPVCVIEDWPAYRLRFLHWDTKHHQERIVTLKRYLDWSARFKVNMIGFELEDKFEYPSHPVIGAPGAYTTAELQEIVDYGLDRFIQVVPQIQAPAHMAYVLKHPEFADLRADGNNYQACMCDERAYDLIFAMYDDVIKATRGVQYLHASTDEVYYAGICGKCGKPYNPENRSLKWVEFAQRAHDFLKSRNRSMLAWVEYPVLSHHIGLLPPDLINGVMPDDPEQLEAEKKRGIRDLIYTPIEGEERFFPSYLPMPGDTEVRDGRLDSTFRTLSAGTGQVSPIGVYGAAWDDSGLHSETFWLGWATVAQYGWSPGMPSLGQHVAEFMHVYYGPRVTGMVEVYRSLQEQARFYDRSWDLVASRVRGEGYGNSHGKGIGTKRFDQTLPPPALPSLPRLDFTGVYVGKYAQLAAEAQGMATKSVTLDHQLYANILGADRNRYNLEVFVSIAQLLGHHDRLIAGMRGIEEILAAAHQAAAKNDARGALEMLVSARNRAADILAERSSMFEQLTATWEKGRFAKGRTVDGKKFYHVLDDTKDHWADRRPDLTYMIAPEESIGLEDWTKRIEGLAQAYAGNNSLPAPAFRQ
jgi:hexosaminidase